ncbi:MAG: Omp28-related outer membrane protein [Weeksellaceae bacterium]|nr:Omp28-related outer membrane protein [Weeksellaceae bacterium]
MQFLKFPFIFALIVFFTLSSCGTEEDLEPDTLTVQLQPAQAVVGQPLTFSSNSYYAGNITQNSTFYVNGTQIQGNTYTPTAAGDHTVYASWQGLSSASLTFHVEPAEEIPATFTKKVMVEDYTGTWCGWCPGMTKMLEILTTHSDRVVPVAIHCDNDPYRFEFQDQLQAAYNTTGLPKARINRIHPLNFYMVAGVIPDRCAVETEQYTNLIDTYLNQPAPAGLAIESSISGNNLNFTVQVGFAVNQLENAKLVVYLLEDGLRYNQVNYFSGSQPYVNNCYYYSQPNPIPNYEHNYTLRRAYTDIFGDEIPATSISQGNVYSRSFNVQVPAEVENNQNLRLVAFVMGTNANEVVNVQQVTVGQSQAFD